jgi:tetratricopeptide (TPR) repeat protein
MGRNAGTSGGTLSSDEAMYDRLSPAEAHDIIRRKLQRLADSWALAPADVHCLARQVRIRRYGPGEIILPRRAHVDCLGLIIQGQVAVHIPQRRRALPVVVLLPGSTFGEAMLAEGHSSAVTLQALAHCEIWFVCRAQVMALAGKRQTERRVALLRSLVAWGALALAAWFALLLLLILPGTRPALALVPMAVGQLCCQQGYDTCAEKTWSIAANLAPTDVNPLLALGMLYFERDAMGTAEQYFEAAKAVAPDSPEVLNNLGLIYAHQGEHERAIEAFEQALELEPGIAAVENNLARSLQAVHNYDEALAHYRMALSLGTPQANTWANMAIAYLDAGQPDEAEDAARQALRYDADLAPAHTVLGAVALEARKPDEALAHLYRAIALDGAYGQAHFYLGLVYKSLDQPYEAVAAFEQALVTTNDEVARVRIRGHLNELYESEGLDRTP